MKKIALLDINDKHYEPYDRKFILQMVYEFCVRNSCIVRNPSMTSLWCRGYKDGAWEDHCKWVSCVSFEIDEITNEKWKFLNSEGSIGSWAVKLKVLPDDEETTIIHHSEFT